VYLSVIIPLYNSKDTIIDTINSVVNQTYKEVLEIIVINDGSTDGSEKLVEDFIANNKTSRIIKLINQPNSGVSSARNRGIKESSGEYIAFLDSDDEWHPKKLEIVMNLMKENNINFLGHSYTLENNFDKTFENKILKKVSFLQLLFKNFATTPSIVMKREICSYFDEDMTHTEDHELWLRVALKHNVYYVDLPLVKLGRPQLTEGGLSANRWAMRKGEIQMYKNIAMLKRSLVPFLPFLLLFSLMKHIRQMVKANFAKK
jgi:glycosyltransferase involved in cell wall biosynthesis